MARRITFGNALQLQLGSLIQIQVVITDNGSTISRQNYTFNANHFSCVQDEVNPNQCTLHLGYQHSINIDNGTYQEYYVGASSFANINLLVAAIINDVSQYALNYTNA